MVGDKSMNRLGVAVIGAGPVGMAVLARLVEKGIDCRLFESGEQAGENISKWSHVRMFSPWMANVDEVCGALLARNGWKCPTLSAFPTGGEFVANYLLPLSNVPSIRERLSFSSKVTYIHNRDDGKFEISINDGASSYVADALIDCGGTFQAPRKLTQDMPSQGGRGLDYLIPDFENSRVFQALAGKRVSVFGSGHSAISSIYGLLSVKKMSPDTKIVWCLRKHDKVSVLEKEKRYFEYSDDDFVKSVFAEIERSIAEGHIEVRTPFICTAVEASEDGYRVSGDDGSSFQTDHIVSNIGYQPVYGHYDDVKLDLHDKWKCLNGLYESIQPESHGCLSVKDQVVANLIQPTRNCFVLGQKSYGIASTFLVKTGYLQAECVVNHLADQDANGKASKATKPVVTYRHATPADLESIQLLLNQVLLPSDDIEPHLDNFIVACSEGKLVATVGMEQYGTEFLVRSFAIDKDHRGWGIDKELMQLMEEYCGSVGALTGYLLTTTIPRYLERYGFSKVDRNEVPLAIQGTKEFASICPASAICMTKAVRAEYINSECLKQETHK